MRTKRYWRNRYDRFINNTLDKDKVMHLDMAKSIEEEMDHLKENKEKHLEEDPENFILFLFINYELNQLDPIGLCYPGISNEYASYAWKIVDLYKSQPEDFSKSLEELLDDVWYSVGNNPDNERTKIRAGVRYIIQAVNSVYK